jgi:hypothetical protein
MNTTTISQKFIVGTVMLSLLTVLGVVAPYANASTDATTKAKKTVNLTCMQTAVDTREDAISKAFGDFNDSMDEALSDRKDALHDAWGITNQSERSKAVKTAWKDWNTAKKTAYSELRSDRKAIWATFTKTAKTTCKESLPKDEALDKDAPGTIAL